MHLNSMLKDKYQIIHLLISQELFYLNKVIRKNFFDLTISVPYESPAELIIYCVVMFLTSSGMEQDLHTNIKKWCVRVYIVNGYVTINKIDDRS